MERLNNIYLLRGYTKAGVVYKLGCSTNIKRRIQAHTTSNPGVELVATGYARAGLFYERAVHSVYSENMLEWYSEDMLETLLWNINQENNIFGYCKDCDRDDVKKKEIKKNKANKKNKILSVEEINKRRDVVAMKNREIGKIQTEITSNMILSAYKIIKENNMFLNPETLRDMIMDVFSKEYTAGYISIHLKKLDLQEDLKEHNLRLFGVNTPRGYRKFLEIEWRYACGMSDKEIAKDMGMKKINVNKAIGFLDNKRKVK